VSALHRFARHLAETAAARDPAALRAPLPLDEIATRLMPYRACRRALGLDSAEDYDLLLLRLAAEDAGLAATFPAEAAERCREEVTGANPDLSLLWRLEGATVRLNLAAIAEAPLEPEVPSEPAPNAGYELVFLDAVTNVDTAAADEPPQAAAEPEQEPEQQEVAPELDLGPMDLAEQEAPDPAPAAPPPAPVMAPELPVDSEAPSASEDPMPTPAPSAPVPTRCPTCAAILPVGRPVQFCPDCGRSVVPTRCTRCSADLEPGWRHCVMCGELVGGQSRFA